MRVRHGAGQGTKTKELTFASLTLLARYGLPPRSGWFLREGGGKKTM